MIEIIVEYLFSFVDYAWLLFLFHKVEGLSIHKRKFLFAVFCMALLQNISELLTYPRMISVIKDNLFITCFLICYAKNLRMTTVFHAITINSLFVLSLTLGVTLAQLFGIYKPLALMFSMYRIVFTIGLKLFMLVFMMMVVNQLKKLKLVLQEKTYKMYLLCMVVCTILAAIVLQLSELGSQFGKLMLVLILFACFIYYTALNAVIVIQKNHDLKMYHQLIDIEETQIKQIMQDQKAAKELMHDTKNMFIKIRDLSKQGQYHKIIQNLDEWEEKYYSLSNVPVCLNPFIDAILQQKLVQYPNINFQFKIQIPEELWIDQKDLLTLLIYLFDVLCEKEKPQEIMFSIQGNENELSIIMECRRENLIKENFQLQYINEIVEKYHGVMNQTLKDSYECSIFLFH